MSTRYKLKVEYVGTNYFGSQRQLEVDTIQSKLEEALCTLTKQNIKLILSGRTDRGVHAVLQVAHFDCDNNIVDRGRFLHSLNGILPNDICVKDIEEVSKNFHAQKSAKKRHYCYTIANRKIRCVFDNHVLLYQKPLDENRINQALGYLLGRHDFSAFKATNTENPAKVCNMYEAKCIREGELLKIHFVADRFLYKMVRTIVGTLIMIEQNSFDPSKMKEILDSKLRQNAGKTISPDGLTLVEVIYWYDFDKLKTKKKNINGGNIMKTYSAKPLEVERKWYLIDANGQTLGRLATTIANILRGKNKPQYTPNVDTGDFVVVINAKGITVTGKKETDKIYYSHSGYPGGLKSISFKDLMEKDPRKAIEKAVKGMLPHNTLGAQQFTKLKVYADDKHPHEAQKPIVYNESEVK